MTDENRNDVPMYKNASSHAQGDNFPLPRPNVPDEQNDLSKYARDKYQGRRSRGGRSAC